MIEIKKKELVDPIRVTMLNRYEGSSWLVLMLQPDANGTFCLEMQLRQKSKD
jgi:hypothetical protein